MKTVALALALLGLVAAPSYAKDVYLVAKEHTMTLPAEDTTPAVDFNAVGGILSYGGSQDSAPSIVTIEDGGATLHIVGNAWKKIAFPYAFTPDTVLELDFKSTVQGEIHGIGFDDDDTISVAQTYQFWGTQTPWGIQDTNTYPSGADVDGWQHYVIPVGAMFSGNPGFMTFTNDADGGGVSATAESLFRNVKVHEPGSVAVTMWGFAEDVDVNNDGTGDCYHVVAELAAAPDASCDASVASSPGPQITLGAGAAALRIFLVNLLPEPVSIVVPGLEMPGFGANQVPVWDDGSSGPRPNASARVRSFTHEAAPDGGFEEYRWTPFWENQPRPGTFLYHSGTNPAVEVQMGLYGAMVKKALGGELADGGEAYPGIAYDRDVVLLYSEIDPALHAAVAGGTYGTPAYPSTINYAPRYFLINGASYDPLDSSSQLIGGLRTDQTLLIRFLNAGLETHVPTLNDPYMDLIGEDGNAYPFARTQYNARLVAGKTIDAVLQPTASGTYAIYDSHLALTTAASSPGGMISFLQVLVPGVIDFNSTPVLSYGGSQDDGSAAVSIEDGGATLHIVGNAWKAIAFPYAVTPGATTIDFDFRSDAEGEIHGIGFDDDLATIGPDRTFELYGTQVWGLQDANDYPTGADINGWKHYTIVVPGGYPLGGALYLVFANDHDVASPNGESYFRNVTISN